MKIWGLVISEKRSLRLSDRFNKIFSSKDPNEKLIIKREAFLNIPLFKKVFDEYLNKGLPKKLELMNYLENEYKINPTYSSSVSGTIIDSIQKYFKEYGNNSLKTQEEVIGRKEIETHLLDFAPKNNSINIKITSPIGNFNLEATNKEELEKILKIINTLWEGEKLKSELSIKEVEKDEK
jgi:hypothetical protein